MSFFAQIVSGKLQFAEWNIHNKIYIWTFLIPPTADFSEPFYSHLFNKLLFKN